MLGLKNYLLPQLEEGNVATILIQHLPNNLFILLWSFLSCCLRWLIWYHRTNKIKAFLALEVLPFFGKLIQTYLTAYYAREWGSLIGQGLDMPQIVGLMQDQKITAFS